MLETFRFLNINFNEIIRIIDVIKLLELIKISVFKL